MTLPTQTDLKTLGFARLAEPFAHLTAASVTDTGSGEFARLATPFIAPSAGSTVALGMTAGAPTIAIGGTAINPQAAIAVTAGAPTLALAARSFAGHLSLTAGAPTIALGGTESQVAALALTPGSPTLALAARSFSAAIAVTAGAPTIAIGTTEAFHAALALVAGAPSVAISEAVQFHAAIAVTAGAPTLALAARSFVAALALAAGAPMIAIGAGEVSHAAIALTAGAPTLAMSGEIPTTLRIALVAGHPTLAIGAESFNGGLLLVAGAPSLAIGLVVQPHGAIAVTAGAPTLAIGLNAPVAAAAGLVAGHPVLLIIATAAFPHSGPLQVTSVSPRQVGDPTTLVILGSGFNGATRVMAGSYGTYVDLPPTVISDTEVHAEFISPYYLATGSHDPITVDVQVFTVDQPLGSPLNPPVDQVTFLAPPTVYSIVPISGTTAANTPYTIYGRNLNPAFLVQLGPFDADSSPVVSPDGATLTGSLITAGFQGNLNDAYPVRVWNRAGPSDLATAATFTVYPGRVPFTPTATPVDDALSGRFGPAVVNYRFEQRTKSFGFIADLTEAIRSANSPGVVHLDNNQAVARTCDLSVGLPELLPGGFTPDDPDTFNVAIWADVVVPGVGITSIALGLFHLDDPVLVQSAGYAEWQAKGSDMAFFLAQASSPIPYVVPAGSVYLNVVAGLCRQYGLAEGISVIGGLQYTTPFDFVWPAGTTFLAIANELLAGINYYPVWADEQGVMRTRFRNDPATETPAVFYRTDAEPKLVAATKPSQRSRSVSALFNQISVAVDDPRRVPYTAFRTNADPNSPASTVKSGRANFKAITGSDTPGTRAILNTVMADTLADWLVRDQAAMAVSRTIQTHPDPRRTNREWIQLTLDDYEVQTLWRVVKYDLTLAPGGPHDFQLELAQEIVVTA